ncbi:MAG: NAD(P)/FAD-dependent oxidoreductase [Deltaproteobacteria bacterium]|nr:NAD(P)/FAD-dependent oxidoreductase [Deltaproteobacteria bacterium]MBW2362152.1 NAD(P)/FAD-dependent oxidoreductase [Deltaproteobacteria bacterium]
MQANSKPRFAIIGAGMSGILSAVKLKQAGLDFTVFEKAEKVGGTWRENTYPGIACDVPSHLYCYSFAMNPDWSYASSPGAEIQAYFEGVANRYEVEGSMRFGDAVTRCEWTGEEWEVETASGYSDRFDWVVAATGILHHPKYPDIEGLDSFEGAMFHSARWDPSVPLDGKRIGLIGNGSSGVQITGALAPRAAKFSLFQRTAQWVVPIEQVAYSEEQRAEFRRNPEQLQKLHQELDASFHEGFGNAVLDGKSEFFDTIEKTCTDYLEKNVADADLRAKLLPDYTAACKRLVISHDFFDSIQLPNAELVTEGIKRIESAGIRTVDGRLHELDLLVLATGFHVDAFMRPMTIRGHDGILLDDVWKERPSAYMSIGVPNFPNFFMLNGPNSPVGNFSLIRTAEMQFDYMMQLVEKVRSGELDNAMPTQQAATRFEEERTEAAKKTVWASGCNSWYLDDRGIPAAWPFPFSRFCAEMSEPKFEDFAAA